MQVDMTNDGTIVYTFPEETFIKTEAATMALRWSKTGRLQQQWQIYETSNVFLRQPDVSYEWRDVPVEE